ncbi:hypothetical protein C1Y02_04505 [Pseudomonas sp. FW306-02-F04-AA]|nr:hypothetical protein C1Y02_04505 [Pseudomonas sp. FW306-02-F04-AA]
MCSAKGTNLVLCHTCLDSMSSPEIGLHLFHPNARCIASGVLYFKDRCGRPLPGRRSAAQ